MRSLLLACIVMMSFCKNSSQTLDIVNAGTHPIQLVHITYPGGDHRITGLAPGGSYQQVLTPSRASSVHLHIESPEIAGIDGNWDYIEPTVPNRMRAEIQDSGIVWYRIWQDGGVSRSP